MIICIVILKGRCPDGDIPVTFILTGKSNRRGQKELQGSFWQFKDDASLPCCEPRLKKCLSTSITWRMGGGGLSCSEKDTAFPVNVTSLSRSALQALVLVRTTCDLIFCSPSLLYIVPAAGVNHSFISQHLKVWIHCGLTLLWLIIKVDFIMSLHLFPQVNRDLFFQGRIVPCTQVSSFLRNR